MVEMNEKEQKVFDRDMAIINFCKDFAERRFEQRQRYSSIYYGYDEILKSKQSWQSKFVHSFPFVGIEAKASFFSEGVLGSGNDPVWEVQPWDVGPEAADSAKTISKHLRYQLDRSNFGREFYMASKDYGIFGECFLETYWDYQEVERMDKPAPVLDFDYLTGRPVFKQEKAKKQIVIKKDQPEVRALYVNDVWPDPKARRFEDARFYCVRRVLSFDQLKFLESLGRYTNVDKLKGTIMPDMSGTYYLADAIRNARQRLQGKPDEVGGNYKAEEKNELVEVIDIYFPATGYMDTIANRSVLLSANNRLYDHLQSPVEMLVNYPTTGELYGISDFEAIESVWRQINKIQNLETDNYEFNLRGYTLVDRSFGARGIEELRRIRPGSVVVSNNPGAISHQRPDLFNANVTMGKQALIDEGRQTLGLNDILSGATPDSNVRSQQQFATLANFGSGILRQSIKNLSLGVRSIGQKWVALNQQFLDLDTAIPVLGESALQYIKPDYTQIPLQPFLTTRLSSSVDADRDRVLDATLKAINMAQNIPGFNVQKAVKTWFRKSRDLGQDVDSMFLISEEETEQLIRSQFGMNQQDQNTMGPLPQDRGMAGATQPNPVQTPAV